MKRFIVWLASAGYLGYFPLVPGTAGTFGGVLVYVLFSSFPPAIYLLSLAATFFLAWWASERAEFILGRKDSPRIVIDEVVGYLIAMTLLPPTVTAAVGGFLFFRVFDIIKPAPAKFFSRRMPGGLAVVLDDAVAGTYSNFLLQAIAYWQPDILLVMDKWIIGLI